MGKGLDLTPRKKTRISTLLSHCKYSQREIASIVGVSQSSVRNISNKLKTNTSLESVRMGRCGRKRITSPRTDRIVRNCALQNRRKPVTAIKNMLQNAGIALSERTLARRFKELGLKCCRPLKKPKLTAAMKEKRLQWAKKYKDFTAAGWSKVCFSDESSIQILQDKNEFVRRRSNEKYKEECVVERVKHPRSIMIWSVISSKGNGPLYVVQGMMRKEQYESVLRNELLPQVRKWFSKKNFIFMHDPAPCHKAKSVTAYLENEKIKVLDWPGNSLDMNPIENMWEALKKEITKKGVITNKNILLERINEAWKMPYMEELTKKCVSSMPRRVQALIAAKGGFTKY